MKTHTEDWKELCRQASTEQDSEKLMQLTRKINELLSEKQQRLDNLLRGASISTMQSLQDSKG